MKKNKTIVYLSIILMLVALIIQVGMLLLNYQREAKIDWFSAFVLIPQLSVLMTLVNVLKQ